VKLNDQVPQSTKDKTSVRQFNFALATKIADSNRDALKQKSSRPNKHSNLLQ